MKFNNSLEGTHSVVEKKKLVYPVRSILFLRPYYTKNGKLNPGVN